MAQGRFRAFLLGGMLGAGVALLFAPRAGKETRAYLTERAEELWGEGAELYSQGFEKVKAEAANVQRTAVQGGDELRIKIENARSAIAEQIAKNAQSARDAINAQMPLASEKISQTADVVKGQLNNAAQKIRTATTNLASKDADAINETAAAAQAAAAPAQAAAAAAPAVAAEGAASAVPAAQAAVAVAPAAEQAAAPAPAAAASGAPDAAPNAASGAAPAADATQAR